MTITPDDKDWTWVLDRACEECGVVASAIDPARVGDLVRYCGDLFASTLDEATTDQVRTRSSPERWSLLEYACHVSDVFTLYEMRLGLMVDQDDPIFPNWDQDESAVADDYNDQDPAVVAERLRAAASSTAKAFDRLTAEQMQRRGRRSDGASFTIESFARYFVHDPLHHLVDVGVPIDEWPVIGSTTR